MKRITSILLILTFCPLLTAQETSITIQGSLLNLNQAPIWSMLVPPVCDDFDVQFVNDDGEITPGEVSPCGTSDPLCYSITLTTTVSNDPQTLVPNRLSISQNYPNPFNPITSLHISIPDKGQFEIFDILGREVQSASLSHSGEYEITWGGKNLEGKASPAGVYLYRLTDGKTMQSGKMTLLDGGSTSGLSIKPSGHSNQPEKRQKQRLTSINGRIQLSASCITSLDISVSVSNDTTIHLICNIPPVGNDQSFTTHIKQRITKDLNALFYLDSPAIYEMEEIDQCSIVEDHFLQYIPLEEETISFELIAIDSLDTALKDTILITANAIDWDTTSHIFTYEMDTLGLFNSMILSLDVIDENNMLFGGIICPNVDSTSDCYNYAVWSDGEYELLLAGTTSGTWIRAIKYFDDDDIWVTSHCFPIHWDGIDWTVYQLQSMGLDVCVGQNMWGTSSDNMYFVGDYGIVHYDGTEFTDVGNGIDVPLFDIAGTPDGEHIFTIGIDNIGVYRNIIMEYHGAEWDTLYYIEDHYWPGEDDYGSASGIGVFGDTLFVVTVAGYWKYNYIDSTSIMSPDSVLHLSTLGYRDIHIVTPYDIFFQGGAFRFTHYNGSSYYTNAEIYDWIVPTPTHKSYYDGNIGVVTGAHTPEWMGLVVRWYHE